MSRNALWSASAASVLISGFAFADVDAVGGYLVDQHKKGHID